MLIYKCEPDWSHSYTVDVASYWTVLDLVGEVWKAKHSSSVWSNVVSSRLEASDDGVMYPAGMLLDTFLCPRPDLNPLRV